MEIKPKNKPIIPWQGGKSRLAKELLPKFPDHSCYVELFCGGAALFFMRDQPAKTEVINDSNGELINLYRVVQNHLDEFVRQIEWALTSRQIFAWEKSKAIDTLTDIQRAARFFYLQQHAFGGKVTGQNFGYATTGRSINRSNIEKNLRLANQRLDGVYVENLPWDNCFDRYDREHTLFYADPPYLDTAGYGVDFPIEQYELLADKMKKAKGKVMLSINDHPKIREIFAGFKMESTSIVYSIGSDLQSKSNRSNELIITNY
ncbi:DNA adenine methylase [Acinetobacter sp. ETR1]|uniref:DNA adenine methylase n=1 Tax=Acinetobacter sp. ETR1 TaxID=1485002 RepID=UPI0004D56FF1|nr:DNA adenine methylase [Acinetobacter sp. ETR1]KEC85397.1 restriction endonuclease subunit M [Acinetobacter sp. ETR1]